MLPLPPVSGDDAVVMDLQMPLLPDTLVSILRVAMRDR